MSQARQEAQGAVAPIAPTITSATFSGGTGPSGTFRSGDTITLTLKYTPGMTASTSTFTGTGTDPVTGLVVPVSGSFTTMHPDTTQWKGTDDAGRVYLIASDDGTSTAVLKAAV